VHDPIRGNGEVEADVVPTSASERCLKEAGLTQLVPALNRGRPATARLSHRS